MRMKLYNIYQKSYKQYTGQKELERIFGKPLPKPTKANDAQWIDHSYLPWKKVCRTEVSIWFISKA